MLCAQRPADMVVRFGYYWPDGLPSEFTCPPIEELILFHYRDSDQKPFILAYTKHQMEQNMIHNEGCFVPYVPLIVTERR